MNDSGNGVAVILGQAAGRGRTFDLSALPVGAVLLSAEIAEPDGTLKVLYRVPEPEDELSDVEECCLGCEDLKADVDDGGLFHYCRKSSDCPKFRAMVDAELAAQEEDDR